MLRRAISCSDASRFQSLRASPMRGLEIALVSSLTIGPTSSELGILEPISKPFEEDHETSKLDKAEEIVGVVRPSSSAAGRIRARHGRAPSRASCSPTSGALTADDCERRADGCGAETDIRADGCNYMVILTRRR